jgi:hypothetical protein
MDGNEGKKVMGATYVPFKTFLNALDHLKAHGVPNIIDRSVFPSMNGATQSQLLSGLQFLGLIDAKGIPNETLISLVNEVEKRKENLRAILEARYSNLFAADLTRVTPSQFDSLFSQENYGISGDTRKKAKSFLFFALAYTGVAHSKLLTQRTRSPRKKRTDANREGTVGAQKVVGEAVAPVNEAVDQNASNVIHGTALKSVILGESGKTVWLGTDANVLEIKKGPDRDFIFALNDLFDEYEASTKRVGEVADETSTGFA